MYSATWICRVSKQGLSVDYIRVFFNKQGQ